MLLQGSLRPPRQGSNDMDPRIYLLGRPQFERTYQEFLDHFLPPGESNWSESNTATPAERIVEFAGRVCYMSFGSRQSQRTNGEYIANLIRNGHESVLEHAVWTIVVDGVSRAFTHQLVRHRVGFAFSQLSQQYHDESEARFVRPAGIDPTSDLFAVWQKAIEETQLAYRKLLKGLEDSIDTGPIAIRREATRALRSAARSVLPNATETAIVVTANARALRNFFKTRGNIIGDFEMRLVAARLFELLRPEGPALFADFLVEYLPDGLPIVIYRPLS
jgi:thymidylate synthase (FAD)